MLVVMTHLGLQAGRGLALCSCFRCDRHAQDQNFQLAFPATIRRRLLLSLTRSPVVEASPGEYGDSCPSREGILGNMRQNQLRPMTLAPGWPAAGAPSRT